MENTDKLFQGNLLFMPGNEINKEIYLEQASNELPIELDKNIVLQNILKKIKTIKLMTNICDKCYSISKLLLDAIVELVFFDTVNNIYVEYIDNRLDVMSVYWFCQYIFGDIVNNAKYLTKIPDGISVEILNIFNYHLEILTVSHTLESWKCSQDDFIRSVTDLTLKIDQLNVQIIKFTFDDNNNDEPSIVDFWIKSLKGRYFVEPDVFFKILPKTFTPKELSIVSKFLTTNSAKYVDVFSFKRALLFGSFNNFEFIDNIISMAIEGKITCTIPSNDSLKYHLRQVGDYLIRPSNTDIGCLVISFISGNKFFNTKGDSIMDKSLTQIKIKIVQNPYTCQITDKSQTKIFKSIDDLIDNCPFLKTPKSLDI